MQDDDTEYRRGVSVTGWEYTIQDKCQYWRIGIQNTRKVSILQGRDTEYRIRVSIAW